MELLTCLNNAADALKRKDYVMVKFWNEQYLYQMKNESEKLYLKNRVIQDIKQRQEFRNTLLKPVYETTPSIDHIRIIYVKK